MLIKSLKKLNWIELIKESINYFFIFHNYTCSFPLNSRSARHLTYILSSIDKRIRSNGASTVVIYVLIRRKSKVYEIVYIFSANILKSTLKYNNLIRILAVLYMLMVDSLYSFTVYRSIHSCTLFIYLLFIPYLLYMYCIKG